MDGVVMFVDTLEGLGSKGYGQSGNRRMFTRQFERLAEVDS